MLTNNQAKLIHSLVKKKFRQKYNKFTVEGIKIIREVLAAEINVEKIYTTQDVFPGFEDKTILINERELKKISGMVTPNVAVALCEIPEEKSIKKEGVILVMDDVRDPGNLGTIIRLADWFGISQIVCSPHTVDLYNPKTLQASMGSFLRVQINYTELIPFFESYKHPVLGTFMDGENIYQSSFAADCAIVLGNEANGISEGLAPYISSKISIPRFGDLQQTESLNVAMAAAVILGEAASQKLKRMK